MRRGRKPEIKINESGLYGFNLSSDFTSEHEWGIDNLKSLLGMPKLGTPKNLSVLDRLRKKEEYNVGIEARTIQTIPDHTLKLEKFVANDENYYVLICYRPWGMKIDITEHSLKAFELYPYPGTNITAAWDDSSFGLLVSEVYKKEIEELYNAMLNKNVIIATNNDEFDDGGLNLIIKSQISKEDVNELYDLDMDRIELKKASEEIGLDTILNTANKRHFALSPKWLKDAGTMPESKYKVVYWLNPYEQHRYNFGWYTVEQLLEWAEDKGPVIKKN